VVSIPKLKLMKAILPLFALALVITFSGCGSSSHLGDRVKEPFQGSKYESNNRFFRAVGKAESSRDNIARSRADIDAKTRLAGQVETNIRAVTDDYIAETQGLNGSDIAEKFQSLSREVMNTNLSDLRIIGEEKYFNGSEYTVFIAYEIRKNAMFRFMKKQARTDAKIDKVTLKAIEDILDAQIAASEE